MDASIGAIVDKLDSLFGLVDPTETLLSKFYNAEQDPEESVTKWSCRLEDIMDRAKDKGGFDSRATNEMLRSKLWLGLRNELREASRHKYDTVKDYDTLRIEVRRIESEQNERCKKTSKDTSDKAKKAQIKITTTDSKDITSDKDESAMKEIQSQIAQMSTTIDEIKDKVYRQPTSVYSGNGNFRGRGYNPGRGGWNNHGRGNSNDRGRGSQVDRGRGGADHGRGHNDRGRGNWTDRGEWSGHTSGNYSGNYGNQKPSSYYDVTCYRCGQKGHLQYGCRVDISHLNMDKSTVKGQR